MSSETLIESPQGRNLDPAAGSGQASDADSLQPWQLFTLAGLIGATIVVFISRGQTPAGVVLLSLTIFTAAAVGVAAWRTLAPLTGRDDARGAQMLGGRTRAALEREKALVLRSIKELEFDRDMRKVSDKDFAEMSTRLRARAARLIRQLDAGTGYREQIEREIAQRVGVTVVGLAEVGPTLSGRPGEPDKARPTSAVATDVVQVLGPTVCISCGTENDVDARFCKNCGTRMEQSA